MSGSDRNNRGSYDDEIDPFADLAELLETNFASGASELPAGRATVSGSGHDLAAGTAAGTMAAAVDGRAGKAGLSDEASDAPDLDRAFADALNAEFERPSDPSLAMTGRRDVAAGASGSAQVSNTYASWVSPRGQAVGAPTAGSTSGSPVASKPSTGSIKSAVAQDGTDFDASLESELEIALSNLSSPANPRQTAFHRSEAFAPERSEAMPGVRSEEQLFDDFDELIASELAAMRPMASSPQSKMPTHASPHADAIRSDARGSTDEPALFDAGIGESQGDRADLAVTERRDRGSISGAGKPRRSGRSWGLGASLLAIGAIGGFGAYVLSGNDLIGAPGDVLVVKADPAPVKVAPKDPGGKSIPNQNKAVYERVQSASADIKPAQKTLLTAVEEPVDLPTEDDDNDLPGVDLNPIATAQASETASQAGGDRPAANAVVADADASRNGNPGVLQPRRVRTLTVRPDGTLVVQDTAAPEAPASAPAAATPALLEAASRPIEAPQAAASLPLTPTPEATAPAAPVTPIAKPETAPAAVRTASAEVSKPEPVVEEPSAKSAYYVQIASQPSEAAAKQSQSNMTKRYASVIGGRNVVIQSAEIAGKGTYYRVKVGADSREEANSLCSSLKSAGGSCFVSR